MMWHYGFGGGGWLVMGLAMIIFWAVVIIGGIAAWRAVSRSSGEPVPARPTPEQLLEERLARGEIDAEEFNQRRELLRSGR